VAYVVELGDLVVSYLSLIDIPQLDTALTLY